MQATPVDPRDVVWEHQSPTYRVYFWGHPGHPSDEYRLTGATSVHQVLAWANENAGQHRTVQVWVEARTIKGMGLISLAGGDDPTDGSPCR